MLLQIERGKPLVDDPHRPPQFPARGRQYQNVVHETHIEQARLLHRTVEFMQEERAEQWTQRTATR